MSVTNCLCIFTSSLMFFMFILYVKKISIKKKSIVSYCYFLPSRLQWHRSGSGVVSSFLLLSYHTGKGELKLHTGIQVMWWNTCRCIESETVRVRGRGVNAPVTHLGRVYFGGATPPTLPPRLPEGAGRLMPRMTYRIISLGVRLEWHLK